MKKSKAVDVNDIRVNDREQLIYLLTEAAEIEHGLMCCYLYAAWSLRQSIDENVSATQLGMIDSWRRRIQGVAMEEMLHLALVNNLLMSLGSAPHFARQNFPVPPGYHPASIVLRLQAFTRDTLAHFIYLERPEGMDLPQARGFESEVIYRRSAGHIKLTPNAEDYDTVGHLYRGIEHGFEQLAARLGESALFIGAPAAQIGADILSMPGIRAVTSLADARAVINTIVEQGEGGRRDAQRAHYAQFLAIAAEYDAAVAQDPDFRPYRDLAPAPVMFLPMPGQELTHVSAPVASRVLDLANACYGLMLRLLASGFSATSGATMRKTEIDCGIELMGIVKTLGITLSTLPAAAGAQNASMNFHLPRSALALPQREAGTALLAERAFELGDAIRLLSLEHQLLSEECANKVTQVGEKLSGIFKA